MYNIYPKCVVSCFQIRNFVTSNNDYQKEVNRNGVVSCFQIRNFVTSNNPRIEETK